VAEGYGDENVTWGGPDISSTVEGSVVDCEVMKRATVDSITDRGRQDLKRVSGGCSGR
jgi:hypothetical protein